MTRFSVANFTNPFISQPGSDTTTSSSLTDSLAEPEVNAANVEISRNHKAFHLIIPASQSNPEFCKTFLSASILGYPAPTLINWGLESKDGKIFKASASHTAKIKGVFDFLSDKTKTKDDDMVLIVDGYDVWFQLPPSIMIQRFNDWVENADAELLRRYGMISEDQNGDSIPERVPRYQQRVIFGADKLCWPNPHEDPACTAVPYSVLPKDIYGADTDKLPNSLHNRPRWLNSGNVMGRVKDVRKVYDAALKKVEKGSGGLGDQYVFAAIFGEQEFQRETQRRENEGWLDYLTDALGTSASPLAANVTMNNMTTVPGQRYEFGIGLDYRSSLFQTMTHSVDDVDFIYYNTSTDLLSKSRHHSLPLYLPKDLQAANSPLSYASPGNHSRESDPKRKGLLLPYSPKLDSLPDQNTGNAEITWRGVPLATNTYSSSIPALLHINGDKSLLKSWWPKIWFHPYGRALLRRFIRSTQTVEAAEAAEQGGVNWWDMRGGRGGVWTDKATWMPWHEVCSGVEDALFDDGKGVFGKEEGDQRRVNSFGKVLIGEPDEGDGNVG